MAVSTLAMLLVLGVFFPASSAADDPELLIMRDALVEAGGDWAAIEDFLSKLSPEVRAKVMETYPERIAELQELQRSIEESGVNWTANMNPILLLPPEDRLKLLGSLSETDEIDSDMRSEMVYELRSAAFPTNFDWRNFDGYDWTTPVRDQGPCGSCWAFGAAGAVESRMKIAADNPNLQPELSEQEILSCSPGSCGGWYLSGASDWMKYYGVVDENCYPYLAIDTAPCHGSCTDRDSRRYYISDWSWIGSVYNINDVSPDAIAEQIISGGPVGTYMEVWSDFYGYSSGIYKKTPGAFYEGGHSVVIVGWGYDPEDGYYWICKNSWDTTWGEAGWFRIKMGEVRIEDQTIAHQPRRAAKILFYEGHNPPSDFSLASGYAEWGNVLAANGYLVHRSTDAPLTLDLLDDYDAVIISSPKTSFSASEVAAIKEFVKRGRVIATGDGNLFRQDAVYKQDNVLVSVQYLDWLVSGKGGGLLIMSEWGSYAQQEGSFGPSNQVANPFGLIFNSDVIIDPKRYDNNEFWPILGLKENVQIFAGCSLSISKDAFPLARATPSGYVSMSADDFEEAESMGPSFIAEIAETYEIELDGYDFAAEDTPPMGLSPSETDLLPPDYDAEPFIDAGESPVTLSGLEFSGPIGIAAIDFGRKGEDAVGLFKDGVWDLDYDNDGVADKVFGYGASTDVPVVGDWNGDGKDTVGVFRNGVWFLDYDNDGVVDNILGYGTSTDVPVVGDWNGDGKDTAGIFRNGGWHLDYDNDGVPDKVFGYGTSTDLPVVGDWNGDGKDTAGIFRSGGWHLDYDNDGVPDEVFGYGTSTDLPVVGDWNGDGKDTVGVFRNGLWFLDYDDDGVPDKVFGYGTSTDLPVLGDWYKT
jgi:hypothetical protein